MAAAGLRTAIVDIHTHVYLPRYMDLLRQRSTVPRAFKNEKGEERLLILPSEDVDLSTRFGRPIGPEYYDINVKLDFMKRHGISKSIISIANPWLDFLPPTTSTPLATSLNNDLQHLCTSNPSLYAFGILPTTVPSMVAEIHRIATLSRLKGVIISTLGAGNGLDDDAMDPVWGALEEKGLTAFVHPHYGVGDAAFGGRANGHVMGLALGFPFETTVAVSRLILAGVFDRYEKLKLLLAHSGGTLPFLAGRLDSCVAHDPVVKTRLKHPPSRYLRKLYYDAVVYHPSGVAATVDFLGGCENMMFGTDNPFFPPLNESPSTTRWESVDTNLSAISSALGDVKEQEMVLGGNAMRIFDLE
ncbi:aminocarboxymuconate-semialdehyde decarboxylase [Synchytrium microbalum]|uniref:Aminocarboxymuconate-semialdehyde decarboxylase n=1 Tax=Synchytrium microbalum TaxID=1806994 RepID=A0A507C2M9_9FUNG|nr:aminocarboxymuconate-semialdehyde decarboxylase [Synchytrium microbalum]TPX33681.1 aminocarboxymuconate-semialdehyde decarboxylase [Synchytrium microbalum]